MFEPRVAPELAQPTHPEGRLGAIAYLQLGQYVRDMVLHGLEAEVELARDLRVAATLGDEREHLRLPVGQGGSDAAVSLEESLGRPGAEDHASAGHRADRGEHLLLHRALEQVTPRTHLHRGRDAVVVVDHGEHEYAGCGV